MVHHVAATSNVNFAVVEGVRTRKRQIELYKKGKSKTLNSKHIIGRAVDVYPIVNGRVEVRDWMAFKPLVDAAKRSAKALNLPIEFGYDWGWDAPHWEMKEP